jgi:hypothetical protein
MKTDILMSDMAAFLTIWNTPAIISRDGLEISWNPPLTTG